ncbi:hypothetical protein [Phenylobacterium sp.]|jgi:hypothetical protein|uniref:hypothetical protein n=1 Tax=Phenylobacterium sp. TaxID=1871053 RepID=UPI002F94D9AD
MKEFVDLPGASGATYRFKLLPKGATPLRIAGNYALLRTKPDGYALAHLGVTNDLSKVREEAPALAGRGPHHLYIRLNVARSSRENEHADIAAAHRITEAAAAE